MTDGGGGRENVDTALHVAHIFLGDATIWHPEALGLRGHNAPTMPLKVHIAIVEGLRDLHLQGPALKEAQKRSDWQGLLGVFHRSVVIPEQEPLLFQQIAKRKLGVQRRLVENVLEAEKIISQNWWDLLQAAPASSSKGLSE